MVVLTFIWNLFDILLGYIGCILQIIKNKIFDRNINILKFFLDSLSNQIARPTVNPKEKLTVCSFVLGGPFISFPFVTQSRTTFNGISRKTEQSSSCYKYPWHRKGTLVRMRVYSSILGRGQNTGNASGRDSRSYFGVGSRGPLGGPCWR